jgi:uncharacterized membrane protein YqjE
VTTWAFSRYTAGHTTSMSGTSTQPRGARTEPVPDGHRSAAPTATPAPSAPAPSSHAQSNEPSTADLIRRATEQLSTLVRDELALARAEMTEKLAHAGKGAGLFGGAGLVSLYGVFGVLTAAVLGLSRVMPGWAAALVVGGFLLVLAGIMALAGRGQVRKATPPVPESAVGGVRADIEAVASAVEHRGHHS